MMTGKTDLVSEIKWTMQVPIFRNSVILRQLGLALGIPFGLLCIFLIVAGRGEIYAMYALGLIATLFLFTYVFVMVVYGGKYDVGYVLDRKGIRTYTLPGQASKNRIVNGLTVALGILSGKPAAAGAGMLAASRQSVYIPWNNIRKIKFNPRDKVIMVRGALTERIALFCREDNYQIVKVKIHDKTAL